MYNPSPKNDFYREFRRRELGFDATMDPLGLDNKKAGKLGIVITVIAFISVLIIFLVPLMSIEEIEYSWGSGGIEEESSEWKTYDFFGDEYLFGKEYMSSDDWKAVESINAGRYQGLIGSFIAMGLGIVLIVTGFINSGSNDGKKGLAFARGLSGLGLMVPAVLMIIFGSKFIGLALSSLFSTDANGIIPISPIIVSLVGIGLLVLSFRIIKHEKELISSLNRRLNKEMVPQLNLFSRSTYTKVRFMLIAAILVLATMHFLPIFLITSEEEGSSDTTMLSLQQISAYEPEKELGEAVSNYETFNTMAWVSFSIVLFIAFALFFYDTNWSPFIGGILLVCGNMVIITIIIQFIFKLLGIIKTFTYDEGEGANIIYGINYLPLLAFLGLIVITIFFAIGSIKGLVNFVNRYGKPEIIAGPVTASTPGSSAQAGYSRNDYSDLEMGLERGPVPRPAEPFQDNFENKYGFN